MFHTEKFPTRWGGQSSTNYIAVKLCAFCLFEKIFQLRRMTTLLPIEIDKFRENSCLSVATARFQQSCLYFFKLVFFFRNQPL